jgi:hypothetical protein
MEVGHSFLAQSHLNTYFWIDTFQTVIYLTHQLPSLVPNHMSPYAELFQKELDYSILRVFGCACYPLLRPYFTHKLSFHSKQCIFPGYSSNHGGYKCLDLISKRILCPDMLSLMKVSSQQMIHAQLLCPPPWLLRFRYLISFLFL